jgi:hypothetical protein
MILNLNKDFFLGAIIWYLMLNCIFCACLGLIDAERPKKYSTVDNIILAALCLGWVMA